VKKQSPYGASGGERPEKTAREGGEEGIALSIKGPFDREKAKEKEIQNEPKKVSEETSRKGLVAQHTGMRQTGRYRGYVRV